MPTKDNNLLHFKNNANGEKKPYIIAVLYSGGSNGVGEWKVDNAVLNVARRPQATAGTSTILVK